MNKQIFKNVIILLLFLTFNATAQDKIGIALGNSTNTAGISAGDMSSYEGAVLSGIRQTGTCTTLERKEWVKILQERGVQKTEEFLDGKIVTQSASLGAEYLLLLDFQSLQWSEETSISKGKKSRKIEAVFTIGAKLVSVETGEVSYDNLYSMKESQHIVQGSDNYAVVKSNYNSEFKDDFIKAIRKKATQFIYEAFPPQITVFKSEEVKKKKAKKVYCRTNALLQKNSRMEVYTEEVFDLGDGDKEVISKVVGELIITEVVGKKVVLCKVKKGGGEIYKAMENKETLKCRLTHKSGMLDGVSDIFNKL